MNLIINVKDYGKIQVELFPELAPIAIEKVKSAAGGKNYDGRKIERLEPNFVIQPVFHDGVEEVFDELIELEAKTVKANNTYIFERGTVAMAGTADKASAAQFFITTKPLDRLNGNFTVIGTVEDGWNVIEKLEQVPVKEGKIIEGEDVFTYHYPEEDVIIESVEVE